jgi:FkbM family methyltransferase
METQICNVPNVYTLKCFKRDWISIPLEKEEPWEAHLLPLFKEHIKPHTIFLDAGSNIGCHSIYSALNVDCIVYSFEMCYEIYQVLLDNIRMNNCKNIVPFHCALTDTYEDTRSIQLSDTKAMNNFGGTHCNVGNGFRVSPMRLDDLKFGLKVSMLKIDVEGYESKLLQGAKKLIETHKPTILIEIWKDKIPTFDFEYFKTLGYKIRHISGDDYLFTIGI